MRYEVSQTYRYHRIDLAAIDQDGHRHPAGRLWPVPGETHEQFEARAARVVAAMADPGRCPDCGESMRRVHPFGSRHALLECACGYAEYEIPAEEIERDFPGVVR